MLQRRTVGMMGSKLVEVHVELSSSLDFLIIKTNEKSKGEKLLISQISHLIYGGIKVVDHAHLAMSLRCNGKQYEFTAYTDEQIAVWYPGLVILLKTPKTGCALESLHG